MLHYIHNGNGTYKKNKQNDEMKTVVRFFLENQVEKNVG